MKITAVELLRHAPPSLANPTPPRRPSWLEAPQMVHPVARYRPGRIDFNSLVPWEPAWVRVRAEDGTFGLGRTTFGGPVASVIGEHLGPALIGEDCLATDRLADLVFRLTKPYGSGGLAACAASAMDLALWDLKGKLLGQPVWRLLGGGPRTLRAYATTGDVDWAVELGFDAVKVTLPFGPERGVDGLDRNEAFIARCRETVGDSRDLMVDCWMSLDVEYAVRLAERLRPYRLAFIEECLLPEDLEGYAALRERLPWQTLATGEHWHSALPFHWAAKHRVADILQPDIEWCGGLTTARDITAIAQAAGLRTMLHLGGGTPFGQHASTGIAAIDIVEYRIGSAPGVPLAEANPIPGAAVPEDGRIGASDSPGFGIEIPDREFTPW